jgi:hypothetical protein
VDKPHPYIIFGRRNTENNMKTFLAIERNVVAFSSVVKIAPLP